MFFFEAPLSLSSSDYGVPPSHRTHRLFVASDASRGRLRIFRRFAPAASNSAVAAALRRRTRRSRRLNRPTHVGGYGFFRRLTPVAMDRQAGWLDRRAATA
jgi:hypothetical protein